MFLDVNGNGDELKDQMPAETPPQSEPKEQTVSKTEETVVSQVRPSNILADSAFLEYLIMLPVPESENALKIEHFQVPTFFSQMEHSFVKLKVQNSNIPVEEFLLCCGAILPVFDVLGSTAFAPVKMDVQGNINKLEKHRMVSSRCYVEECESSRTPLLSEKSANPTCIA